jgi:hypothetical protein
MREGGSAGKLACFYCVNLLVSVGVTATLLWLWSDTNIRAQDIQSDVHDMQKVLGDMAAQCFDNPDFS